MIVGLSWIPVRAITAPSTTQWTSSGAGVTVDGNYPVGNLWDATSAATQAASFSLRRYCRATFGAATNEWTLSFALTTGYPVRFAVIDGFVDEAGAAAFDTTSSVVDRVQLVSVSGGTPTTRKSIAYADVGGLSTTGHYTMVLDAGSNIQADSWRLLFRAQNAGTIRIGHIALVVEALNLGVTDPTVDIVARDSVRLSQTGSRTIVPYTPTRMVSVDVPYASSASSVLLRAFADRRLPWGETIQYLDFASAPVLGLTWPEIDDATDTGHMENHQLGGLYVLDRSTTVAYHGGGQSLRQRQSMPMRFAKWQ